MPATLVAIRPATWGLASLTKACFNAATKPLAIEYARRGIRVNAVSRAVIKSSMHPVETHEALEAFHPVRGMSEISNIVEATPLENEARTKTFAVNETALEHKTH
jgi:NAD(P)-dependent dehydrogenase (short-subunit alcohol dehydrogenase family)